MQQDGLSATDVELVNLNGPDIPAAFASKTIDAAWNAEPGKDQPEAAQRFVIATVRGMRDYYHSFIKKDVDASYVERALDALGRE